MRGGPGRCPDATDFQIVQIVCGCCWACGVVGNTLCCPQIHRLAGAEDFGPAQPARHAVRTCRIGEAGTAPTSTAKSRIDAVPHTVLSTHAGAVFQSLPNASMCAVARGGDDCPTVSVRALPNSGARLQATATVARFTAHKAVHRRLGATPSARPGGATRPAAAVG